MESNELIRIANDTVDVLETSRIGLDDVVALIKVMVLQIQELEATINKLK